MNRRGFLAGCLALGAAPAIIKVENAMRLWVPKQGLLAESFHVNEFMHSQEFTRSTWGSYYDSNVILVFRRALTDDELRRITA